VVVRKDDGVNRWQVRQVANLVNGSTLLGCAVAIVGRARIAKGPRGLLVATGYRLPVPVAPAFTVGNLIASKHDQAWLDQRPALMRHEERHTWQYVACLGLPMLPLYLLAAGWSYLRGGHRHRAPRLPQDRPPRLVPTTYAPRHWRP
jgi:hypothetical protein